MGAVVFLASDASAMMTGTSLHDRWRLDRRVASAVDEQPAIHVDDRAGDVG